MKIKAIPVMVLLMALALIGTIFIQYTWIRKSIDEKQALIDNKVVQAVTNVDIQLSDVHALTFFADTGNVELKLNDTAVLYQDDATASYQPLFPDQSQHTVDVQLMSADSLINIAHTEVHNHLVQMDCMQIQLGQIERELHQMHEVQSVFRKIQIEVNPFLADSRLDSARIGKLLKTELRSFGLDSASNWGVYDHQEKKFHILPASGEAMEYEIPLFKNDIVHPQRYSLRLSIANSNSMIWTDIRWMALLSLIFLVIILSVFVFSIRLVVKHKKISQIKSDFINNMTHEFKTPLASISLAADSIIHPNIIGNKQRVGEYVSIIQQEKAKLNQNVERILEVAALEKGVFEFPTEKVNIGQCTHAAIKDLRLLLDQKNARITVNLPDGVMTQGSAFHLQNAVANIIENALKYCSSVPDIKIDLNVQGNQAVLTVKDNGIGLTKQQTDHVFDNFYRVETGNIHTTKGFGLGLTYTKFVIEKMGGEISIASELNKGTLVTVQLPRYD